MSSKNKRGKHQRQQPKPSTSVKSNIPNTPPREPTLGEKISKTMSAILSGVESQDLDQVQDKPMPTDTTEGSIVQLFNDLEQSRQLFEIQRNRLEEDRKAFDKKLAELDKRQQEILGTEQSLAEGKVENEQNQKKWEEEAKELVSRQQQLNARAADLDRRDVDARLGFQAIYQDVLEKEHQRLETFSADLERLNQEFMGKRREELTAWQSKLAEINESAEQNIIRRIQDLEALREKLAEEQMDINRQFAALRRDRNALDADRQILDEDIQSQAKIVEQKVAVGVESYKTRIDSLEALYKQARSDRDHFKDKLIAWDRVGQQVGKEPETILDTIDHLTTDRNQLAEELRNRPSQSNIQRIEDLERQQVDWEQERWGLVQENSELRTQLNKMRIQSLEVESQRDLILALETRGKVLDAHLKELKTDVERRIGQEQNKSPFPQCYVFDQDPDLQNKLDTYAPQDLSSLAHEVKMRIATSGLFYESRDIRSFLAGLAMSRTMILQGISGTGKTSLPWNFAEAVGGGREIIEVQAGWRDRDDLLGHYNAFEQKFYESKFLQALYQAQCPAYTDRIFIILLDEMNLSYPEQYFADLLSVLQMDAKNHRKIDLISTALPSQNYPRAFVNDKRSIRVPDNAWFVGTANQDETTKDIADKTYDRSHIIELPVQHPVFDVQRNESTPQYVSRSGLAAAFDKAQKNKAYQLDASRTWKFLDTIRLDFSTQYAMGWGNRLKKQIDDYVPVILASGGSWAEATDDILSMKVLRKLRNRYEIQSSDLEKLESILMEAWRKSGSKDGAEEGLRRSMQIIKDEQRKKISRQADEVE